MRTQTEDREWADIFPLWLEVLSPACKTVDMMNGSTIASESNIAFAAELIQLIQLQFVA